MYIKKSRAVIKGKTYEYVRLVEGIRVGSKIRHKIIAYLGRTDDPNSAASFLFNKVPVEDRKQQSRMYALPMACNQIMEKFLNLSVILAKLLPVSLPTNSALLIRLMILSRILHPESKLSLTRWYQHLYLAETLPKKIDVHQFYTALDHLLPIKEPLEEELFLRLVEKKYLDTTVVFYDVTSAYFEGEECDIGKKGHSRDHRPDCLQITIGLVIDKTGLPLFHDVFEGNVLDHKTVKDILIRLKQRFTVSKVLFVADKGMLTAENIKTLDELKNEGITYVLSQSPREDYEQIQSHLTRKTEWTKLEENLWYTTVEGRILCYNPKTAKKAQETRNRKLTRFAAYIPAELAKADLDKRKQDKRVIHDRIVKALQKSYMGKYYDAKNDFAQKDAVLEKEELLDGVFAVIGNAGLTPVETIEAYKQEATIEQSFRVIKDAVEVRPIYHYNPSRVKAHVFICVLSYLVIRLLEKQTGKTLKMLREQYMTSVIIDGDTRSSPKQIIGGSIPLQLG